MRIGIDARMQSASGIGRYIGNLIYELQRIDKKNEYFLFLLNDNKDTTYQSNFTKVMAKFPWYGYKEQILFPKLLNQYNLDLMHFPHFNVPILYRGKFVVTIHDLTHFNFKMIRTSTRNRFYYEIKHQVHKRVLSSALKRSERIITVSKFVKDDLVARCGVKESKIAITYEAADERLVSISTNISKMRQNDLLNQMGITIPYLFYVGNAHPHKNIERLINVYKLLKQRFPGLCLVLSGQEDFFWRRLKKLADDKSIIFTNFVSDQQLVILYKNARAFIFPSLSEGFGIPVLEAMSLGCPVVSSNLSALPEIGADAAVYFNPLEEKDMVDKIALVLENNKLRNLLINRGKERSKQFSWNKMAQQTLNIYESSVSS